MNWVPIESSNLKEIAFDKDKQELYIRFHNSNPDYYKYENVDERYYNYLLTHTGKDAGWYFQRVIRNSFPTTRIDASEDSTSS